MGRRGQREDRRPARAVERHRLPLPGRPERGPHGHRRRRDVQVPAPAVGDPLRQGQRARRRLCGRPGGAAGGDRRARGARDLVRPAPDLRQRAPDHAVAYRDRRRGRAAARQAPDRDDPPRDRTGVRRQGSPPRHPRPGPARPEDPAPEDRDGAGGEEHLARAGLRARAVRARGGGVAPRGLRAAAAAVRHRHVAARRRCDPRGQERPARGCAGNAARPRPRHVSLRHLVESDRRRSRDRDRDRADADRPGDRGLEGVRDPGRGRAVPERDGARV